MSELDHIALRLKRGGRWVSVMMEEVEYLLDEEIDVLDWADELTTMLANDPGWRRTINGWQRRGILL